MALEFRRDGRLELKFNEDRTQALATIFPPAGGGDSVTAAEILEHLKTMGVTYGIREKAILDAIYYAEDTGMPAANVVVAQGAVPQDGQDARINYTLPLDLLTQPLPKRKDGSGLPDWFALDPAKMVKAEQELAAIVPAQPGVPGKTLTWPIQPVPPKAGKPAGLSAGQNVRASEDGLHLYAAHEGYVCLQGEQLVVYALHILSDNLAGGAHSFPVGLVCMANVQQAQVRAHGILAIKGAALNSRLHVQGDLFVRYAENCTLIASGNVYVTQGLKHCEVITRKRLIGLEAAQIVGGTVSATEGVCAVSLGASDFTATEVHVGEDRHSPLRNQEIQEELAQCDANIARISQALKPFVTVAAHETLPDDKRQLLQKLQAQQRIQEARIKELHNERRSLSILSKERVAAAVEVARTVHPGVWIGIGSAAFQVETPMEGVRFVEMAGGKAVQTEPLRQAA
ncbi:MAG TPA: FapA family protein [Chthonomonadaceae bacterium]|nr:FapA family protein [Chthonomonadaceae bacterium]